MAEQETLVRIFFSNGHRETRPLANVVFRFLDDMQNTDVHEEEHNMPLVGRDRLVVMMDKVDAISIHRGVFTSIGNYAPRTVPNPADRGGRDQRPARHL